LPASSSQRTNAATDSLPPESGAAPRKIEEIVVTAERKESTVSDTAISITAFTARSRNQGDCGQRRERKSNPTWQVQTRTGCETIRLDPRVCTPNHVERPTSMLGPRPRGNAPPIRELFSVNGQIADCCMGLLFSFNTYFTGIDKYARSPVTLT
jgi:hypothetical protein